MTVMPEKVPLKLLFFVETPLINTVPGFAGLMLWAATVVIVTTFEVRTALAIATDVDFFVRSTACNTPAPPGVMYARWTRGWRATCGYCPVEALTEEITQGGAWPAMRHSDVLAAFPGLMSAIKPMFVFA